MLGLVYKDLMVMRRTLLLYGAMGIVYGIIAIYGDQYGMVFALMMIVSAMVPVSAISYDERSKWDKIVNTMPLSRKEIVLSKYVLAILLTAISSVIIFAFYMLVPEMPLEEKAVTTAVMAMMAMIYQAALMPVMFKFGSEKGRTMMLAILFVPAVLIFAIGEMNIIDVNAAISFLERNEAMIPYLMAGFVLAIYSLSMALSVKIYEKKDL
ncbi:MAG: ABC-2 transporter permease [Oscillospiraceae bacterium]|nr:ABC-2 transporter permease [Oscillospiraceae bacterium]